MRELRLSVSDDLTYNRTGEREPADETVVIALDGTVRELDLTERHAKELRDLLAPYLEAGHPPGAQPSSPEGKSRSKGPNVQLVNARARQRLVREWADSRGLRSEDGKRPIYRTPGGGYYYPYGLMRMYEAHLTSGGDDREMPELRETVTRAVL